MGTGSWHFSPFTFDWQHDELLRDAQAIRLRPKTPSLLRLFLENAVRVVGREEIMRSLWPDVAVTDVVLNVCVAELRRALGDDRARPRYIETAHRRGFRFVARIEPEGTGLPAPIAESEAADQPAAPESLFVGRDGELAALRRRKRRLDAARRLPRSTL